MTVNLGFYCILRRYEQLLLEQDPLPSYALKLLLALIEQNAQFIRQMERLGLVPVLFQVLVVSVCIQCLITARQRTYGKGMFSEMSVMLSMDGMKGRYPWCQNPSRGWVGMPGARSLRGYTGGVYIWGIPGEGVYQEDGMGWVYQEEVEGIPGGGA